MMIAAAHLRARDRLSRQAKLAIERHIWHTVSDLDGLGSREVQAVGGDVPYCPPTMGEVAVRTGEFACYYIPVDMILEVTR